MSVPEVSGQCRCLAGFRCQACEDPASLHLGAPRCGPASGRLLCATANIRRAQRLSQPAGEGHRRPGAPPSFLLQPRSPSPSRPCSLEAGMSPEARSPSPGAAVILGLPASPRGRSRVPEQPAGNVLPSRRGPSLKGQPVHGGWRGPPSRVTDVLLHREALRAPPVALVQKSCWRPGPGLGGLCPAGTEGARPCLAAGPVCRRPSRRPPRPRDKPSRAPTPAQKGLQNAGSTQRKPHIRGGLLQKIMRMSDFFSTTKLLRKKKKKKTSSGVQVSQR